LDIRVVVVVNRLKAGRIIVIAGLLLLSACSDIYSFRPYDYKKDEYATVKKGKSPYSVGLRGKRLVFKKEFEVQH
jgi:hypothetical protein